MMARTVSVGAQDFEKIIVNNCFYVDKTRFIKEWWESKDEVTLITRPRRFGKTLSLSMMERFWSLKYKGQGEIFENLDIWKEQGYRELQGSYPVISLSFAIVKETNFESARAKMNAILVKLYEQNAFLKDSGILGDREIEYYDRISFNMSDTDATLSLHKMSDFLYRYYGRKVIILLDEYDTPLQEAYVNGYWEEMVAFTRSLFNAAFKTNPYMERALMTGITNIVGMKFATQTSNGSALAETMFSDLNNLKVISMTSEKYASYLGFTEEEVFAAMDEFGLANKEEVKRWYDGFTIGKIRDIYNPWSIINFLDSGDLKPYWANTSSNGLVSRLIRRGDKEIKMKFEDLLSDKAIIGRINEEIAFGQMDGNAWSVWSLLLAGGYLKVVQILGKDFELSLTNYEVKQAFEDMVHDWFGRDASNYNDFIKALLRGDTEEMNGYMSRMALSMFSSFDGGVHPSEDTNPERFYHGFVLGLLVELEGRYKVTSNRESGFGRYDVLLEPMDKKDDGIILEFKIFNPKKERDLEETVQAALNQIEEKKYEQSLLDSGVDSGNIHKYGFAFRGQQVLIQGK